MTFSHWLTVNGAIGLVTCILLLKFFIEFDFTERDEEIAVKKLIEYSCLVIPASILAIFSGAWFVTGVVLYINCFFASPAPIHALMTAVIVIGFTNMQLAGK
jgi:VIT1/CCC1 family predicted Fe2+/Mn2+ transporter